MFHYGGQLRVKNNDKNKIFFNQLWNRCWLKYDIWRENRYQRITMPVNHLTQIAEIHESIDVYVIQYGKILIYTSKASC